LLPRNFGDVLNRIIPKLVKAPFVQENKTHYIHAGMNYLYFYLWWRLLTCSTKEIALENGRIFKIPYLFVVADKSPLKFYTKEFEQKLQVKPNELVVLKNHTHWCMQDNKGREFNKVILKWLEETDEKNIISGNGM